MNALRPFIQGQQQPRGAALIIVMVMVLLLVGLAMTLSTDIQTRETNAEIRVEDNKAFEAAEAGLDRAIYDINYGGDGKLGTENWDSVNDDGDGNGRPSNIALNLENNITLQRFGDVQYFTWAIDWYADNEDNNGNGLIDAADPDEENWYTVFSTGFSDSAGPDGHYTTIEAHVEREDMDAVFDLDAALELQINQKN